MVLEVLTSRQIKAEEREGKEKPQGDSKDLGDVICLSAPGKVSTPLLKPPSALQLSWAPAAELGGPVVQALLMQALLWLWSRHLATGEN